MNYHDSFERQMERIRTQEQRTGIKPRYRGGIKRVADPKTGELVSPAELYRRLKEREDKRD